MDMDQHPQSKPHRTRLKVRSACVTCRSRKAKCDGTRCTRPRMQGRHVIYAPVTHTELSSHGHDLAPSARYSPHTPPASVGTPSNNGDSFAEAGDTEQGPGEGTGPDPDQSRTYSNAHGRFAGQVVAAIDPAAGSHQVPFVDAPLFENLILDSPPHSLRPHFVTELPPRGYADQLVDTYWRYVEPVEPILDYQRFVENYENIYSTLGGPPCTRSDLWLCILNVVFALAVQRQEHIPPQQRNEQGNRFFLRAWALLPADLLWMTASLELLQSLILINRYLHCTDNQQKTWMSAGVAIRMAQTMCGHRGESKDEALKLKVWASCVALDRCTSWSLGKTSTLVPIPLPPSSCQRRGANAKRDSWGLRLYEIGNQIQLAQLRTRSTPESRSRQPGSSQSQQEDYCNAALQLDTSLQQWEASLPLEWQAQNLKMVIDRSSRAEGYLLHLRYLHHRIFLYRPMLARIYSMASNSNASLPRPSLSHRLLQNAATMYLEAAQQIATLVIETVEPDQPIGLLPWWYRLYYLHIAGANFLAAMIRPELFSDSIAESWEGVLLALRGHQHLCAYAAQCVRTFERLASRIRGRWARPVGAGVGVGASTCEGRGGTSAGVGVSAGALEVEESTPGICFDDIFQNIDFEIDSFLFGTEEFAEGVL
ncbi:fungal-specific transcription factor domain-containing protein [Lipomyces doorenjongii]